MKATPTRSPASSPIDGLVETYLVESSAGPSRKYYRLTEAGKVSFGSQKSAWSSFSRAVESILGGVK
jgi:PadR family transcriptional regulator PadR